MIDEKYVSWILTANSSRAARLSPQQTTKTKKKVLQDSIRHDELEISATYFKPETYSMDDQQAVLSMPCVLFKY